MHPIVGHSHLPALVGEIIEGRRYAKLGMTAPPMGLVGSGRLIPHACGARVDCH